VISRLLLVSLASVVVGAATSWAQTLLPSSMSSFANSGSGSTALTACLAVLAAVDPRPGALAGMLSFIGLVLGYTIASPLSGFAYTPTSWLAVAVIARPMAGDVACQDTLRIRALTAGRRRSQVDPGPGPEVEPPTSTNGVLSPFSPVWHQTTRDWGRRLGGFQIHLRSVPIRGVKTSGQRSPNSWVWSCRPSSPGLTGQSGQLHRSGEVLRLTCGYLGGKAPVGGQRGTALEGQDRRVLDDALADLDGAPDGWVGVPGVAAVHDRSQEG
jgi:hypothetical protein